MKFYDFYETFCPVPSKQLTMMESREVQLLLSTEQGLRFGQQQIKIILKPLSHNVVWFSWHIFYLNLYDEREREALPSLLPNINWNWTSYGAPSNDKFSSHLSTYDDCSCHSANLRRIYNIHWVNAYALASLSSPLLPDCRRLSKYNVLLKEKKSEINCRLLQRDVEKLSCK